MNERLRTDRGAGASPGCVHGRCQRLWSLYNVFPTPHPLVPGPMRHQTTTYAASSPLLPPLLVHNHGQTTNDDGSVKLEVTVAGEEKPRVYSAAPDAGGASVTELPDVKAMNEEGMGDRTDGRGGVDDLIDLTHLHEPAILHVLVRGWGVGFSWSL